MKLTMFPHIHDDREVSRIYEELRHGFLAYLYVSMPLLSREDLEEIYNDSFMALLDNISTGKLQELTCSLQTYLNQIGRHKAIRRWQQIEGKEGNTIPLPEYEITRHDEDFNLPTDMDDMETEKLEEIYQLVQKMEDNKCKTMLFGFYWHRYSMEVLAELAGLGSADVAKTTKSRCLKKLENAAKAVFRNKGLL